MDNFWARETEWMLELDGIPLAGFRRRAIAFAIDWILIIVIMAAVLTGVTFGHPPLTRPADQRDPIVISRTGTNEAEVKTLILKLEKTSKRRVLKLIDDVVIPVLYFGLLLWQGRGRTPGKRMMKIRVVSVVHRHLSLWHSVERALGYGAAALELGFGFVQYFIHPYRRCVQDRISETIVVTEAGYQAMQHKRAHQLAPDGE